MGRVTAQPTMQSGKERAWILFFLKRRSSNPVRFRIELKQSGKILASNAQKFFSDGSSNTFHVHFDNPVQIEVSQSRDSLPLDRVQFLTTFCKYSRLESICTCRSNCQSNGKFRRERIGARVVMNRCSILCNRCRKQLRWYFATQVRVRLINWRGEIGRIMPPLQTLAEILCRDERWVGVGSGYLEHVTSL